VLRDGSQLAWRSELRVSSFYFSPGFRCIGNGAFGSSDRENWTDSIVAFIGWHICLSLLASVFLQQLYLNSGGNTIIDRRTNHFDSPAQQWLTYSNR
jgi:hypothetical protein